MWKKFVNKILQALNKYLSPYIDSRVVYRLGLFLFSVITLGVGWDMRWHGVYPVREHYFIVPHVTIYVGIVLILICFFLLRVKGHRIPLTVFFWFPALSVFDTFIHTLFGEELPSSPMMFWSPGHWGFGVVILYTLYILYKTHIEDNKYVVTYIKALLFLGPIKLLLYLLIPLSLFSSFNDLHSIFSICIAPLTLLIFITCFKLVGDMSILLPAILLVSMYQLGTNSFFGPASNIIYNTQAGVSFLYLMVFFMLLFEKTSLRYFITITVVCVLYVYGIEFFSTETVSLARVGISVIIVIPFSIVYFYFDDVVFRYLRAPIKKMGIFM